MNNIKKTKFVATLGPATSSEDIIEKMILAGVNVFRVNFSHADYKDVSERILMIRKVDEKLNTNTAILGDLQGPKLRGGKIEEGAVKSKVTCAMMRETNSRDIQPSATRSHRPTQNMSCSVPV